MVSFRWFLFSLSSLVFASCTFSLNLNPDDNKFFRTLPFPWQKAQENQEILVISVKQYGSFKLDLDLRAQEIFSAAHILLIHHFRLLMSQKTQVKKYEELIDWIWVTFKAQLDGAIMRTLQKEAYDAGKHHLAEVLHRKYDENVELVKMKDEISLSTFPTPLKRTLSQKADEFLADLEYRPELHDSLMADMFNVPKLNNLSEALEFVTGLLLIHIKDFDKLLERAKYAKGIEIRSRLDVAVQVCIGSVIVCVDLQNLYKIKTCKLEAEKSQRIDDIVMQIISFFKEYIIPKREFDLINGMKSSFSLKWMYSYVHMLMLHAANSREKSGFSKYTSLIGSMNAVGFISGCRIILALKPFMSKFGKATFPFGIHDLFATPLGMKIQQLEEYLSGLVISLNEIECQSKNYNFAKHFIEFTIPKEMGNFITKLNVKEFKMLTVEEQNILLNKKVEVIDWDDALPKSKKAPKKKRTPAKKIGAVYSEPVEIEKCTITEIEASASDRNNILGPFQTSEGPTSEYVEPPVERFTNEGNVANEHPTVDVEEPVKSTLTENEITTEPRPVKSLINIVAQKHLVSVEDNELEAQLYMDMYQKQLDTYAKPQNGLPLSESTGAFVPGSAKVKEAPQCLSVKTTSVCKWSTNDFLNLFPEARDAFNENINNFTAVRAQSCPNMMFRSALNPKIVIDGKTYKFICQVFGFAPGRKSLKFIELQRAYLQLSGGDLSEVGSKNRTVFAFKHVFVIGDHTYVPPIKSVHPEHASSRFNHIQVKLLLEYNGFHYNFFIPIEV